MCGFGSESNSLFLHCIQFANVLLQITSKPSHHRSGHDIALEYCKLAIANSLFSVKEKVVNIIRNLVLSTAGKQTELGSYEVLDVSLKQPESVVELLQEIALGIGVPRLLEWVGDTAQEIVESATAILAQLSRVETLQDKFLSTDAVSQLLDCIKWESAAIHAHVARSLRHLSWHGAWPDVPLLG